MCNIAASCIGIQKVNKYGTVQFKLDKYVATCEKCSCAQHFLMSFTQVHEKQNPLSVTLVCNTCVKKQAIMSNKYL